MEAQMQELRHLAAGPDNAAILARVKDLIPAYTGWPRHQKGQGNEAKPRGIEAEPQKTRGELGEEAA